MDEQKIFLKQFGKNVKYIRLQQNLTIKELAILSGIPYTYLSKIENGEAVKVSTKHLWKLHYALKIPVYNFFKSL